MPDQDPMGPIIATRTMYWQNAEGVNVPAVVEIGLPYAHGNMWFCRLRLTGLGPTGLEPGEPLTFGDVDSVGALCVALSAAGSFVSTSPMAAGLDWALIPNWGFPVMPEPVPNGGGGGGGGPAGGQP